MTSENLSTAHDDQLKELRWLPWIGNQMDEVPLRNRMLIVGESHYQDDNENSKAYHDSPDCTMNVIKDIAIKRNYRGTKTYQNLHRTLFETDNPENIDHSKFWNNVAFYNFIQEPMNTKKGRPSYSDYRRDWEVFFALAEIIKPKICLFIGTGAANALLDGVSDSKGKFRLEGGQVNSKEKISRTRARRATLIDSENNRIDLIFIQHTSHHYSWKKWNEYLQREITDQLNWLKTVVSRTAQHSEG